MSHGADGSDNIFTIDEQSNTSLEQFLAYIRNERYLKGPCRLLNKDHSPNILLKLYFQVRLLLFLWERNNYSSTTYFSVSEYYYSADVVALLPP